MGTGKALLIGRFCPAHVGHEAVIRAMIEKSGIENSLVGIGSSNHETSIRHFFSYDERRDFLLQIFPGLKVFGIPDYPTDAEWMRALDDYLSLAGTDPQKVKFFGGCQEEVDFYYRFGRQVEIVNRFDGSTPKVSATEVRDALIHERALDGLVNPLIAKAVRDCFLGKWEKFKKM